MAEEYDPWNEIPNEDKIRNCYSLARMLLIGLPLLSILLYLLKAPIARSGIISEEGAQTVISGLIILTVFLCIAVLFTLGYLRKKLKKEALEKDKAASDPDTE